MGMWEDVCHFSQKFQLPKTTYPAFPTEEIINFRIKFMEEELEEFKEAVKQQNLVKAFDALVDLAYVVLGTAYFFNLPWMRGWKAVQEANFQKVRAKYKADSKRGTTFDVVKPDGWVGPELKLEAILKDEEHRLRQEIFYSTNRVKRYRPDDDDEEDI